MGVGRLSGARNGKPTVATCPFTLPISEPDAKRRTCSSHLLGGRAPEAPALISCRALLEITANAPGRVGQGRRNSGGDGMTALRADAARQAGTGVQIRHTEWDSGGGRRGGRPSPWATP